MKQILKTEKLRISVKKWNDPFIPKTKFIIHSKALFVMIGKYSLIMNFGRNEWV